MWCQRATRWISSLVFIAGAVACDGSSDAPPPSRQDASVGDATTDVSDALPGDSNTDVSDSAELDASDDALDAGLDVLDTGPETPDVQTFCVEAPTGCPTPPVVYADVQPVFAQRCVACHNGQRPLGAWPLSEYIHVVDWKEEIRGMVLNCLMPPADAGVPITSEERGKILAWIACGVQP